MIAIPFTKMHGAENDFLLTWGEDLKSLEVPENPLPQIARDICARTTGIGADGWMIVWPDENGLRTRLFNSDGSEPELSGNGTRCAAAFGLINNVVAPPEVFIRTGAGIKSLHLISIEDKTFLFEMDMGQPRTEDAKTSMVLAGREFEITLVNVGNPQCVIFVDQFPPDWRDVAREAEGHSRFPHRSNVSFVRVLDRNTLEAVFYERGAGETKSSGTGSTGAAIAAILRDRADSPIEVRTPAGQMTLRWDDSVYLTGPAELIGEGRYFLAL